MASPSVSERARRREAIPEITYPEQLPVSEHRDELLATIGAHPVVVVAGETGSGKTTQLPKICLELGRGVDGVIGHTQPRRIAARTVAERLAEELHVELGGPVGYAVRFDERAGEDTLVKLMTDGVLLAEMGWDRLLRRYDTIVVDEAHERSLNIDFLLGYLAQLLPRRPDLKVIVTSATIDTARFAEHFGGAPVVEVSGRAYPVEIRWHPPGEDGWDDRTEAVVAAVEECCAWGPGDVLVFLSGEREIRDTADALRVAGAGGPGTEILPLYARLSSAEQHRVFRPHAGRRVVLATNVAETSITVPGIRSVVDLGEARISRYNTRTKVQRLPIEAVSQASADQRAGRCGRLGPGLCVRLYAEEDYASRPAFTEPEILRTNLAAVVLQMAALGLGDIESFPFVEAPDRKAVRAALDLLDELGAVAGTAPLRLTPLGRRLARLPIDPRLGRMILEAEHNGCVREVTVVAAALSIQDPREWPADDRQAASELHRRFADPESDFVAYLNLWEYLADRQRELSSSAFRRLCRRELLNFQRVREWQDLCSQLRQSYRELRIRSNAAPAEHAAVHRSLLAGLLSHIGVREDPPRAREVPRNRQGRRAGERPSRAYRGARGTRFTIGSGSGVAVAAPRWVMAAELVETTRLWAGTVARIDPRWAEAAGAHLVVRDYAEPQWDPRRGSTVALERVTLYGVPLVADRRVDYTAIDPELARELFVRHALVEGDWDAAPAFVAENRRAAAAVVALEDRFRRRDLLVDDEVVAGLYEERIPPGVTSGRRFERWWREARASEPDLLTFTPAMLVDPSAGRIRFGDYPDEWVTARGARLALSYVYDPIDEADGVTVHVPLGLLGQLGRAGVADPVGATGRLEAGDFDWHVPGLRTELVAALIRSLPRGGPLGAGGRLAARRLLVPAAEHAAAFVAGADPSDGPLLDVLARWLTRRSGYPVTAAGWDLSRLPPYLRLRFSVEDGNGRPLATSRDLPALQARLREPLRRAVATAAAAFARPPAAHWAFGAVPDSVEVDVAGQSVVAYPGLVEEGTGVAVAVFVDEAERDAAAWPATRRLLLLGTNPPVARAARDLPADAKLGLAHVPHASLAAFLEDCAEAATDRLLADHGGPVRDEAAWARLHGAVRAGMAETATRVVTRAALVVRWAEAVESRLARFPRTSGLRSSLDDVRRQLDRLVGPGFVTRTGAGRLIDVVRYLRAAERRLERMPEDPARDRARMQPVQGLEADLDRAAGTSGWTGRPDVDGVRWMLEELRVATWAQALGTAQPVSEARIGRAIAGLAASPTS